MNLAEYNFADDASRANAKEAYRCALEGRKGAFVISGNAPGTGKTQLARAILAPITPDAGIVSGNALSSRKFNLVLDAAAASNYLLWDDVGRLPGFASNSLAQFITFQRRRTSAGELHENRCLVVIAGNNAVVKSADLARRLKWIGLRYHEVFRSVARPQRACRICLCTDRDCSQCVRRTGEACHWVEADLCSACQEGGAA